jgi:hypothetical protein
MAIITQRSLAPVRRGRFIIAVLTALYLSSSSVGASDYNYPYHDPYLATATSAILGDDGATTRVKSQIIHLPGLPSRNGLPSLEGRGNLSISLYRQNGPAPLMFIIAGVGSNPYFGVGPYLASLFSAAGFHVVILPSPMTWNFALAASRSGAPGYVPEDARDLYEVMQKSLSLLKDQHGIEPTEINFIGASLGALEGAHLSVIDGTERKIGISKYLLINPPIDLAYTVKKLDQWDDLQKKFGLEKSDELIGKGMTIIDSFANAKLDDSAVFDRLAKKLAEFKTEELQFLAAVTLQIRFPDLIYVTQAIHDQNVLTAPKKDKRKRLQEANRLTLTDYNEKIGLPLWRRQVAEPQVDLESLVKSSSLTRILDQLRNNPKVHIMHNEDDFLNEKNSIEKLKATLGDQVTLYPHGGHLGNLWYRQNKEDVLRLFGARSMTAE